MPVGRQCPVPYGVGSNVRMSFLSVSLLSVSLLSFLSAFRCSCCPYYPCPCCPYCHRCPFFVHVLVIRFVLVVRFLSMSLNCPCCPFFVRVVLVVLVVLVVRFVLVVRVFCPCPCCPCCPCFCPCCPCPICLFCKQGTTRKVSPPPITLPLCYKLTSLGIRAVFYLYCLSRSLLYSTIKYSPLSLLTLFFLNYSAAKDPHHSHTCTHVLLSMVVVLRRRGLNLVFNSVNFLIP